jgi:hypothetical protein
VAPVAPIRGPRGSLGAFGPCGRQLPGEGAAGARSYHVTPSRVCQAVDCNTMVEDQFRHAAGWSILISGKHFRTGFDSCGTNLPTAQVIGLLKGEVTLAIAC